MVYCTCGPIKIEILSLMIVVRAEVEDYTVSFPSAPAVVTQLFNLGNHERYLTNTSPISR